MPAPTRSQGLLRPMVEDPVFASAFRLVVDRLIGTILGPKDLLFTSRVYAPPRALRRIPRRAFFAERCLARNLKRPGPRQSRVSRACKVVVSARLGAEVSRKLDDAVAAGESCNDAIDVPGSRVHLKARISALRRRPARVVRSSGPEWCNGVVQRSPSRPRSPTPAKEKAPLMGAFLEG